MKLQYMAVIFVIIMLPIILVLNTYMGNQIDTLGKDLQYDTKLFEATLDGIQAFELNTVNNRFSQVADSLKRDVQAGINTFISSLSNNLGYGGVNQEYLLPYIPAVLFTLYDGYFIYSPTYAYQLKEDKITQTTADGRETEVVKLLLNEEKEPDYEHLLKPFIYYTTRYVKGDSYDFVVNYTLDNYLVIEGEVNGGYATKSGFLSNTDRITVNFEKSDLEAILARKILEYVKAPRELDNETKSNILSMFQNADLSSIKNPGINGGNSIAAVTLGNEIGKVLYEEMVNHKNLSNLSKNKIIEALYDSIIDERMPIDRTVAEEAISRYILSYFSQISDINALAQNEAISIVKGTYKGNDTNLKNVMNTIKNIGSIEEFLEYKTSSITDPVSKENQKTSIRNNIASNTGVVLFNEMLSENGISNIDDNELFTLITSKPYYINNYNTIMVEKISGGSNGTIDEVIDIFSVTYQYGNSSNEKVNITEQDAKRYYVKSLRFSNWVNDNLGTIVESDALNVKGEKLFEGKDNVLFKTSNTNDPGKEESVFSQHRMGCIQASILTNLSTAIAQYNNSFFQQTAYSLTMPMLTSIEWYQITNNVSMVTFLQGVKVGNKMYNDYAVVSSNKNTETINTDDIHYISLNDEGIAEYHTIDCPHLDESQIIGLKSMDYDVYKDENGEKDIEYSYSSALRDIAIDTKIDQVQACYYCIVNRNYKKEDINTNRVRLAAMYNAIAKEKNNLYKVNDYYNIDIMSEYVSPPVTSTGTLADRAKIGDYVQYSVPGTGSTSWRVLSIDKSSGVVELVSAGTVAANIAMGGFDFSGNGNYTTFNINVEDTLKEYANNYINGTYARKSRILGSNKDGYITKNPQDLNNNNNNILELDGGDPTGGYWLMSATKQGSKFIAYYVGSGTGADSEIKVREAILRDNGNDYTSTKGVRVVVELIPFTQVSNTDEAGEKTNPWKLR